MIEHRLKVSGEMFKKILSVLSVRRTLKGGLTAEEWETVASYSDAV